MLNGVGEADTHYFSSFLNVSLCPLTHCWEEYSLLSLLRSNLKIAIKNFENILVRVRVFQRNTIDRMCKSIYIQKEIYFKDLAHEIMEAEKSKIYRVSWQAGDTEKRQCCSSSSKVIKLETQEKARGCSSSLKTSVAKLPLAWGRISLPPPPGLQLIG